jgi:RNA polymerase sigma factor (TIGR02999 family)
MLMADVHDLAADDAAPRSLDDLVPDVYEDLRRIAHRQLRGERPDHTLGTTALVHEAYLKLAKLDRLAWQSRAHFCAEAARAMRRILVDHAERRRAQKRGGGAPHASYEDVLALTSEDADGLLALHEALERLQRERPRHARVVECRFFGGMSLPEVAEALDLSLATVKRDWQLARAWLNRELGDGPAAAGP